MSATTVQQRAFNAKRRTCMLMITHQCNLNCVYCYESFKSDKAMSLETAIRIVDCEFQKVAGSDDFDELEIDFIGGEPMIAYELMRDLAEWVWGSPRTVPHIIYANTNGTLLTEEMKQWFRRNKSRFVLGLSLDGTPEMQNLNRSGCFSRIDLDFFQDNWPEQGVKMTVSCDTVEMMAEGIIYLQERGLEVHANAGYGMPWDERTLESYGRELRKLAEYYLAHEDVPPVSLLDLKLPSVLNRADGVQKKFCGTGTHMVNYDVDGKAYPCHLFTPLVLGPCGAKELSTLHFGDCSTVTDPKCADCVVRNLCPTCYGFNYKTTGNVAVRDLMMCRLFKRQAVENCWFQSRRLKRKRARGPLTEEDLKTAKACVKIMETLTAQAFCAAERLVGSNPKEKVL